MRACEICNNNTFVIADDGIIKCAYCHSVLPVKKDEAESKEKKPQEKRNKAVKN